MTADSPQELDIEQIVKDRYATGANEQVQELCCPVNYDPQFLKAIPQEVIDRDYGCGDPSRYLKPGETVLDLGSGTGKICFIAAQVVGAEGTVIGIDMTHDMLDVARRNAPVVADRLGYANVQFKRGRIQDLGLDLDAIDAALSSNPVHSADDHVPSPTRGQSATPDRSVGRRRQHRRGGLQLCTEPGCGRRETRALPRTASRAPQRWPRGHFRHRLRRRSATINAAETLTFGAAAFPER